MSSKKGLFSKLFLCDNIYMDDLDFWDRVKILIKQNKTTQENLANSANMNFSNMKQQIFYKRLPDAAQAARIAQALGTSVEYLVTGIDASPYMEENTILKDKLKKIMAIAQE